MKLNFLDTDIYFDEFPKDVGPNAIVFISNLHWLTRITQLENGKNYIIYTSAKIQLQLLMFNLNMQINTGLDYTYNTLPSYEPYLINLPNGKTFEVLMCSSTEDITGQVMFLFKHDNKVKHCYAGNFERIRCAMKNDTFAEWLQLGVEILYLNLKNARETYKYNEISKVVEYIKERLSENYRGVILNVPYFGYENLVKSVACELPYVVTPYDDYRNHFEQIMPNLECFTNLCNAQVYVVSLKPTEVEHTLRKFWLNKFHCLTVVPTSAAGNNSVTPDIKYKYVPFPTPHHLNLLTELVYPEQIKPISGAQDYILPTYLKNLLKQPQPNYEEESSNLEVFNIHKKPLCYLEDD